jgi:hypothetical protein
MTHWWRVNWTTALLHGIQGIVHVLRNALGVGGLSSQVQKNLNTALRNMWMIPIKYINHIEYIQRKFLKCLSFKFNIHPESTVDERCSSFGLKFL